MGNLYRKYLHFFLHAVQVHGVPTRVLLVVRFTPEAIASHLSLTHEMLRLFENLWR
jgi:hypothetical protein